MQQAAERLWEPASLAPAGVNPGPGPGPGPAPLRLQLPASANKQTNKETSKQTDVQTLKLNRQFFCITNLSFITIVFNTKLCQPK